MKNTAGMIGIVLLTLILFATSSTLHAQTDSSIRQIRFIEDDAQYTMTSRIYTLHYQKANDLVPFVTGAVKRYAKNASVDRINHANANKQLLCVSCPVELIPYIDDMVQKLDRPSAYNSYGSGIDGTGIIRNIYAPRYRGTARMAEIMVKTGIPSNASEGANQDAQVAYDPYTNLIYWKDSIKKDSDMQKYLEWLDRPVPQIRFTLVLYEVRQSTLSDVGIDYLAWKNGPGLNLLDAGLRFIENSALTEAFGPYGWVLFAPTFDFSFLRLLAQKGRCTVSAQGELTLRSGISGELKYVPTYQNIIKDDEFRTAVVSSENDAYHLKIITPCVMSAKNDTPRVQLRYAMEMKTAVERDGNGNEVYESSALSGDLTAACGVEKLLNSWVKQADVEQRTGVPYLCSWPVTKYIFGTVVHHTEYTHCFLTLKCEYVNYDESISNVTGSVQSVRELMNKEEK